MSWLVTFTRRSSLNLKPAVGRRLRANRNHATGNGKASSESKAAAEARRNEATAAAAAEESSKSGDSVHPPPLLNPFPLLAHATENIDLASRLRSYSNTFGIIGALMCTLSITALTMMPVESEEGLTEKMRLLLLRGRNGSHHLYWSSIWVYRKIDLKISTLHHGLHHSTQVASVSVFLRLLLGLLQQQLRHTLKFSCDAIPIFLLRFPSSRPCLLDLRGQDFSLAWMTPGANLYHG